MIKLHMSQIIELLNGREVEVSSPTEGADCVSVTLGMHREDTSISVGGAIERIKGEWNFTMGKTS